MTRYFKATDGRVTVFRQARRSVYRSAHFHTQELTHGWSVVGDISFHLIGTASPNDYPTVEIGAAEYTTLTVLKARRLHADYGEAAATTSPSPQNSWVRNSELEVLARKEFENG